MDGGFFGQGFGLFLLILGQALLVVVVILVSLAFLMYADRRSGRRFSSGAGRTSWGRGGCCRASPISRST
jgi:NADH:ubiquinone oxidoreductase subunit H